MKPLFGRFCTAAVLSSRVQLSKHAFQSWRKGIEPDLEGQTSQLSGMEPHVIFGAYNDRFLYFALIFGGVSVVAAVIARRSWQQFQDALTAPLAWHNGDVPCQREWDFRYWRRMARVMAGLAIVLSILWLIP
jgi:hypothetical protein